MAQPERIRTAAGASPLTAVQVAELLGYSRNRVLELAAAGKIPGARQPFGPGSKWAFDQASVLSMIQTKDNQCPPTSIGAAKRGTPASPFAAKSIDEAYKRLKKRKRPGVSKPGKKS